MNKYQKIFLFSILIVAFITIFDIWAMNSGVFGKPDDYLIGNFTDGWWQLFYQFNLSLIILISGAYYWFGKHDFSESISLFISSLSLWLFFGIADILFFIFRGLSVPQLLPWLNNSYIGKLSSLIVSEVTSTSLYLVAIMGLFINYFLIKYMVEKL